MDHKTLRRANVTRYITPLREGGSLPALAEADDGFKYVVKFRGAGHGTKALVSELIGGEIARAAGLRVPELVFLDIDEDFGRKANKLFKTARVENRANPVTDREYGYARNAFSPGASWYRRQA